jgi:hypothetical protein
MFDWILKNVLQPAISPSAAQYMLDRKYEYSYLGMNKLGLQCCFGDVTSNVAENINHVLVPARDAPITRLHSIYLTHLVDKVGVLKVHAQSWHESGMLVCDPIIRQAWDDSLRLEEEGWTACLLVIDSPIIKGRVRQREDQPSWDVTLRLDGDDVWDRILCPCNATRMRGFACKHAAFILGHMRILVDRYVFAYLKHLAPHTPIQLLLL